MNPVYFKDRPGSGNYPDAYKHGPPESASERDKAERGICGGHKSKYHDVIQFSEAGCFIIGEWKPVKQGADGIERDHTGTEYGKGCQMPRSQRIGGFPDKQDKANDREHRCNEVGKTVKGFSEYLGCIESLYVCFQFRSPS